MFSCCSRSTVVPPMTTAAAPGPRVVEQRINLDSLVSEVRKLTTHHEKKTMKPGEVVQVLVRLYDRFKKTEPHLCTDENANQVLARITGNQAIRGSRFGDLIIKSDNATITRFQESLNPVVKVLINLMRDDLEDRYAITVVPTSYRITLHENNGYFMSYIAISAEKSGESDFLKPSELLQNPYQDEPAPDQDGLLEDPLSGMRISPDAWQRNKELHIRRLTVEMQTLGDSARTLQGIRNSASNQEATTALNLTLAFQLKSKFEDLTKQRQSAIQARLQELAIHQRAADDIDVARRTADAAAERLGNMQRFPDPLAGHIPVVAGPFSIPEPTVYGAGASPVFGVPVPPPAYGPTYAAGGGYPY